MGIYSKYDFVAERSIQSGHIVRSSEPSWPVDQAEYSAEFIDCFFCVSHIGKGLHPIGLTSLIAVLFRLQSNSNLNSATPSRLE